jgi:hypothetical protein
VGDVAVEHHLAKVMLRLDCGKRQPAMAMPVIPNCGLRMVKERLPDETDDLIGTDDLIRVAPNAGSGA